MVPVPPTDYAAHHPARRPGQVWVSGLELHPVDSVQDPPHLPKGVHRLLHAADVLAAPYDVDCEVVDPYALGEDVLDAVGLGHYCHVRADALLEHVDGPDAALKLPYDRGEDKVSPQPGAGPLDGEGGHEHRRDPRLHVVDPGAPEPVPLHPRLEGVPLPTLGDGVYVQVAVEHHAPACAVPLEAGYDLPPPRLYLLDFYLFESVLLVPVDHEVYCRPLPLGQAGASYQVRGQVDDLFLPEVVEHFQSCSLLSNPHTHLGFKRGKRLVCSVA